MDVATIANVATALTLIAGVGFGLVEAHRSRRLRQERAASAAVQAILTSRMDEVDGGGELVTYSRRRTQRRNRMVRFGIGGFGHQQWI